MLLNRFHMLAPFKVSFFPCHNELVVCGPIFYMYFDYLSPAKIDLHLQFLLFWVYFPPLDGASGLSVLFFLGDVGGLIFPSTPLSFFTQRFFRDEEVFILDLVCLGYHQQ